jgi:hypothetical protein
LAEGKVIGVIQISRKAAAIAEAGPEFTSDKMGKLMNMLRKTAGQLCFAALKSCCKRRLTLTLDTLLVTFPQH